MLETSAQSVIQFTTGQVLREALGNSVGVGRLHPFGFIIFLLVEILKQHREALQPENFNKDANVTISHKLMVPGAAGSSGSTKLLFLSWA